MPAHKRNPQAFCILTADSRALVEVRHADPDVAERLYDFRGDGLPVNSTVKPDRIIRSLTELLPREP